MKFTKIKTKDSPRTQIRLPRMGKIRLGVKMKTESGKEYPKEVNYFVVPPEVKAVYGEEPTCLRVMLPVEQEEMFFRQYYAVYGSNQKLKCQGDGEKAERRVEGKIVEMACPSPDDCEFANERDEKNRRKNPCAARVDLMVVLPEVICGGVYQISTGSINSDIDIRSGIEMARGLYHRVSWVPMALMREEKMIPDPETGQMTRHWPVKLIPLGTASEVNEVLLKSQGLLDKQKSYLLPEPVIEGEEDTPTVLVEEEAEAAKPTTEPSLPIPPSPGPGPLFDNKAGQAPFSMEVFEKMVMAADSIEAVRGIWMDCLPSINAMKSAADRRKAKAMFDRRVADLPPKEGK